MNSIQLLKLWSKWLLLEGVWLWGACNLSTRLSEVSTKSMEEYFTVWRGLERCRMKEFVFSVVLMIIELVFMTNVYSKIYVSLTVWVDMRAIFWGFIAILVLHFDDETLFFRKGIIRWILSVILNVKAIRLPGDARVLRDRELQETQKRSNDTDRSSELLAATSRIKMGTRFYKENPLNRYRKSREDSWKKLGNKNFRKPFQINA